MIVTTTTAIDGTFRLTEYAVVLAESLNTKKGSIVAEKEWKDLSSTQKGALVLGGTVQIGLLLAALLDIYRRPKEEIRGNNKWLWTLAAFVNFVGPISYFLFGRKR